MERKYEIEHSIRGDFFVIRLTKRYKGMPGFAPDYHDIEIGRVVVKFRDEEPYFQTGGDTHMVLNIVDIKEISTLLKRGYVKKDFSISKK